MSRSATRQAMCVRESAAERTPSNRTVELRGGRVVADGNCGEHKWDQGMVCPQCGDWVWGVRYDAFGKVNSHVTIHGRRERCEGT